MPLARSPALLPLYITAFQQPPVHSVFDSRPRSAILFPATVPAMPAACRVSLLLLLAVLTMDLCYSAAIQGYDQRLSDDVIVTPKKRPFCNAFTGCGRKRSMPTRQIPELGPRRQYIDEDTFVPMMEPDNGIEELSRQILSEAKLWEAIQEASADIARRKQREAYRE